MNFINLPELDFKLLFETDKDVRRAYQELVEATKEDYKHLGAAKRASWAKARTILLD